MNRSILITLIAGSTLLACSNGNSATSTTSASVPGELPSSGAVLNTVLGVEITEDLLAAALSGLDDEQREQAMAPENAEQLHTQIARENLLYSAAIASGIHNEPETQNRIILAERDAIIQLHLKSVVDAETTDEKLQEWYDAHLVRFHAPQAHLNLVLSPSEEEAAAAFAELTAGAEFAAVAEARSIHQQSAANGGDLDWVIMQGFDPETAATINEAEIGAILEPTEIPGQGVWQILQVLERREVVPFDEVKDMLAEDEEMMNEIVQDYIEGLVAAASPAVEEAPEAVDAPTTEAPAAEEAAEHVHDENVPHDH